MRRALALLGLTTIAALAAAPAAGAQSGFQPYFGEIPFRCELQQAGTGTAFPDPAADPFCVEYDKTQQNVTDLGVVAFALQEPARVAAALGKCFYFQRDHWTGSIVQGEDPETYNFDGNYFVDRGRGVAGGRVENLRVAGMDPSSILAALQLPRGYEPFIGSTGEGMIVNGQTSLGMAEPRCAAMIDTPEERDRIYGSQQVPAPAAVNQFEGACEPAGRGVPAGRVGPVRLRSRRERVREVLGDPDHTVAGFDRYCLRGGGSLRVGYHPRASVSNDTARVLFLLTTSRRHSWRGLRPGGRLPRTRLVRRFRLGATAVMSPPVRRRLLVGVRAGRVRWLALAGSRVRDARPWLRRALR